MNEVIAIGGDLAKNVFQVHGVDAGGGLHQRKVSESGQPLNRQASSCNLPPLSHGSGAVEFEVFLIVEVTFLVEMVVD